MYLFELVTRRGTGGTRRFEVGDGPRIWFKVIMFINDETISLSIMPQSLKASRCEKQVFPCSDRPCSSVGPFIDTGASRGSAVVFTLVPVSAG
jgi:hypothetical protein